MQQLILCRHGRISSCRPCALGEPLIPRKIRSYSARSSRVRTTYDDSVKLYLSIDLKKFLGRGSVCLLNGSGNLSENDTASRS